MMEICKYCGNEKLWRSGVVSGKQRYQCSKCRRRMTEKDGREKFTDEERKKAVDLYLEGNGSRKVARILSDFYNKPFKNQTIIKWGQKAGEKD